VTDQPEVRLAAGPLRYRDAGSGEPILFLHGILADGLLWRKVTALLMTDFRCISPDLPLGSHRSPMDPAADLTPPGLVRLVIELLDAIGADEVTVVGNDTGGALAQLLAAHHPERVRRLVLTPCDAYENFPPRALFLPLRIAAAVPGGLLLLGWAMRMRLLWRLPISFAGLAKHPLDPAIVDGWMEGIRRDRGVRHDLREVIRGLSPSHTMAAAERLRRFDKPALIAWAPEAPHFTLAYGQRLLEDIPGARLDLIADSYTFVSEDQPERLVASIRDFIRDTGE